jgi:SAM-dependent methyltransferase
VDDLLVSRRGGRVTRSVSADATFEKYAVHGAYHWREVGRHLLAHNAFTAERYRTVADHADLRDGQRVLDYGCGDGALLGVLARRYAGRAVDLHGYDPNALAIQYGREAIRSRGISATLHESPATIADGSLDCVICTEVIEHASAPAAMLEEIARMLKAGGRLVITTPIRLTEEPGDPNHVQEWFPTEFARLFGREDWRVLSHDEVVPSAAIETYFWRPPMFGGVPVFRLLCNVLSICAGVNAMSWLRLRPRLFMMQIVVAEKTSAKPATIGN